MHRPTLLVLLLLAPPAGAQAYLFSVPEAEVTVTVDADGSALIHYSIAFECAEGAHPIDVVDIGMPNMSTHEPVSAAVDGTEISRYDISVSSVLEPRGSGYEVPLGTLPIPPGERAVFEFRGLERDMVWQDLTDPELASFRFSPTWFGSAYVVGETDLVVRVRLPIPAEDYPAVKDRILWQRDGEEFSAKGVMEGEDVVSVGWARTVRLTGPRFFSVSFPKSYVASVRKDTILSSFWRWFRASPAGRFFLGVALLGVLAAVFFVTTRGTGWSVFLVLAAVACVVMYLSPTAHLVLFGLVLALGVLLAGLAAVRKRRKPRYFEAEMCLEGGGIKRGLTAVEAAVLLEVPLARVLTMIVFGLARKGVMRVARSEPLMVEVLGRKKGPTTWGMPDGGLVTLWPYEPAFLEAFASQPTVAVEFMTLDRPFAGLLEHVSNAMLTFDLDETRSYYRSIVSRAWDQVKAEAGYEAASVRVDRHVDWLMIDDGWREAWSGSPATALYRPTWWYGSLQAVPAAPSSPATAPTTTFGDVASGLVGRMENLSLSVIQGLDGLEGTPKGGIDLSSVDGFAADALQSMFDGSGGGGGSSGGCACACAGCACACACAGGGR
jgi:hypothetical protein